MQNPLSCNGFQNADSMANPKAPCYSKDSGAAQYHFDFGSCWCDYFSATMTGYLQLSCVSSIYLIDSVRSSDSVREHWSLSTTVVLTRRSLPWQSTQIQSCCTGGTHEIIAIQIPPHLVSRRVTRSFQTNASLSFRFANLPSDHQSLL